MTTANIFGKSALKTLMVDIRVFIPTIINCVGYVVDLLLRNRVAGNQYAIHISILDTSKITAARYRNQQFTIVFLINNEPIRRPEKFLNGGLWTITARPRPIGKEIFRHVFDYSIEHDEITVPPYQRRVGFKFSQYMLMRMVRIKRDDDRVVILCEVKHLFDYIHIDG